MTPQRVGTLTSATKRSAVLGIIGGVITRTHVLAEIKRTAAENGGKPLGFRRFEAETGIRETDWLGKHWARWNDAVTEAGLEPNLLKSRLDDDGVLAAVAIEVRRLGRFPTISDLRLGRHTNPVAPSENVFKRYGTKASLVVRLADFCDARPGEYDDVRLILAPVLPEDDDESDSPRVVSSKSAARTDGDVYLLKLGQNYKVGKSIAFGQRERQLAIQMPARAKTVHVIKTDDPTGIERYWHQRFADRRVRPDAEWFALTAEDVAAFKRRKFQ